MLLDDDTTQLRGIRLSPALLLRNLINVFTVVAGGMLSFRRAIHLPDPH